MTKYEHIVLGYNNKYYKCVDEEKGIYKRLTILERIKFFLSPEIDPQKSLKKVAD